MAVVNFGSINIDHVYQVARFVRPGETLASQHYQRVLGGKGANQSIALARAGSKVVHIGAINQQDSWIIDDLSQAGVDTAGIQLTKEATGHAIIQVDQQGENCILLYSGANAQLRAKQLATQLEAQDWLLIQNETSAVAEVINLAQARGLKIAFNPAPMTDAVKTLPLAALDLLIVNEIEACQLSEVADIEVAIKKLTTLLPTTALVITLGAEGALYCAEDEQIQVAAYLVKAVDTTAAGDTFTGYLLAQLAAGVSVKSALTTACGAAALCVSRAGASPSIPLLSEVSAFLETN